MSEHNEAFMREVGIKKKDLLEANRRRYAREHRIKKARKIIAGAFAAGVFLLVIVGFIQLTSWAVVHRGQHLIIPFSVYLPWWLGAIGSGVLAAIIDP